MFKLHTMSSSGQTHHSNRWLNRTFSKEESEEDFTEGLEVEGEDWAKEEDEVMNQSSAAPTGYLGITRGSALMHSAHIV